MRTGDTRSSLVNGETGVNARWHFEKQQPGTGVNNSLQGEFFGQGDQWNAGVSLVRESIQNSMDAGLGDEVSVVIYVSTPTALDGKTAEFWFGSLWPHLRSRECKIRGIKDHPHAAGFIVVEDFGTRGLRGDVRRWQSLKQGEENDYFSFFWADGHSGKTSGAGSWGAGKSVFSRCSQINAFLAASVRADTGDTVIIGKSVLWCHYVGSEAYQSVGRFGIQDGSGGVILPAQQPELAKRLASDFRVRRFASDQREPGLSVIIPYSEPEISPDSVVRTVVEEYFQPILAGRLRVTVVGDGWSRKRVDLDRESIRTEAAASGRPGLAGVIDLADWALNEGCNALLPLASQSHDCAPDWTTMPLSSDGEQAKTLSARYEAGERLALRVPISVHPKQQVSRASHFDVFIQKDLDGEGYKPIFVRDGIVIPNARERSARGHDLFALVMIEDEPLNLMLRAAEPPAHDEWRSTQNFKGLYTFGQQTIGFVTGSPKQLADILCGARTERDDFALADLFPEMDDDGRPKPDDKPKKRGKGVEPPPPLPPPPRSKAFQIVEIPGGFRVIRDNPASTMLPERLIVRAAYDTSRGNPLSKYHSADFALPKLKHSIQGGQVEECEENRLVFAPSQNEFSIEISGFDTNRDLCVKVRVESSSSVGGENE
jgi:hypothetical protein